MNFESIRVLATDQSYLAWLAWVGFLVGLLGIFLSWYFYAKSIRSKRPYCLTFTHSIAHDTFLRIPDLKITYKNKPVPRLAITKLVYWNAGAETIHSTDIPAATPFLLSVAGDAQFLGLSLEFVKKKSNAVALSTSEDKKTIAVTFDYLDRNDGFVVELLHSGESDAAIGIESTFKGAKPLVRRSAAPLLSLPKVVRQTLASEQRSTIGALLIIVAVLHFANAYLLFAPSWFPSLPAPESGQEWFATVITIGGFIAIGAYLLRTRLPAGFNLEL